MDELVRVSEGRMLGGVCTGIARRYGWDVNAVRVAFVVSCLLPGPQLVVYLALWLVMPMQGKTAPAGGVTPV
ncbi:PspC domain-containing protein [Williamsia muralis]|uniref:PspC domain-containing protein n=1 Tax=Williamsia marianensis TaxID=85044 RepID=A0A2G3PJ69_WILMA|nr:PspC domain-containing protein [Williamsia marianensis]PHV65793.1 PspC domain-containing protein [Williamsia marianensis]PZU03469.1 MAG: PspC domain-containing protein [Gordonia sp. (in: high G+C Gram-positive bacteria)]